MSIEPTAKSRYDAGEKFKKYLQQRNYKENTVHGHVQNIGYFLKWIADGGLPEVENISYHDLLNYVRYEQQRNKDVATINLRIGSISKYFLFLKEEGTITINPASTLRIKGKAKTVIQNPLTQEELLHLYHTYKAMKKEGSCHKEKSSLAHTRKTIIVGLLIWQGLHSGELAKLEVSHVNLPEGIIYIPSTARGNSRELKLATPQVLTLYQYLHDGTREKLFAGDRTGSKAEALFPGNLYNTINAISKELKGIYPQIKNALHIRASVILYWLRQYNKRQVQYLCGHKHIDSTQRYEAQELETLTDQLAKHHPFG